MFQIFLTFFLEGGYGIGYFDLYETTPFIISHNFLEAASTRDADYAITRVTAQ